MVAIVDDGGGGGGTLEMFKVGCVRVVSENVGRQRQLVLHLRVVNIV